MRPFVLLLVALALSASSMAQTSWRAMPEGVVVSLDTRMAVGDDWSQTFPATGETVDYRTRVTSASSLLSIQIPIRDRWTLRGELPFAYARHSTQPSGGFGNYADGSALAMGASYIGAEVELAKALVLEAGYRWSVLDLGLTSYPRWGDARAASQPHVSEALWAGQATDPHRLEAYQDVGCGALVAAIRAEPQLTERVQMRLRASPTLLSCGDQVLAGYSAQAVAHLDLAEVSVGVVGQRAITGRFWGREPSTLPSFVVQVSRTIGSVRPGLMASIPLESEFDADPDAVIGFSLDVALR